MRNYDIYGIGNALVDSEYMVSEEFLNLTGFPKGNMTLTNLTNRRNLTHLLEVEHNYQMLKLAGGGSAANTLVAASQVGIKAYYSCKIGNDDKGKFFLKEIANHGIKSNAIAKGGYTGECISMVTPDAERTMVTNLGVSEEFSVNELYPKALCESKILYIEGYLIGSPNGLDAVLRAQAIARKSGVKVALTLSDKVMIENFRPAFDAVFKNGVDILFCNAQEGMLWTNAHTINRAAVILSKACPTSVITCGKDGALVSEAQKICHVPGFEVSAVDTTGAGDNFAGAFLAKLCQGLTHEEAALYANRSASTLVKFYGARLPASGMDDLCKL